MTRIGLLFSRIRVEKKLLLEELERRPDGGACHRNGEQIPVPG